MEGFDLPAQEKIIINSSLCSYCKVLLPKIKKLLALGKIDFYISNGTIRIKIYENWKVNSPLSVTHVNDFRKHFSDIDLSVSRSGWTSKNFYVFIIAVVSFYRLYYCCFFLNSPYLKQQLSSTFLRNFQLLQMLGCFSSYFAFNIGF